MNIGEVIEKLREELHTHNYNYYALDEPTISDFEFDQKLKELERLELEHPEFYDENSPTQRVGGEVLPEFQKVAHTIPMVSLHDVFNEEGLYQWDFF